MPSHRSKHTKQMPKYMKFVLGGLSGMSAAFFVHPFDLIKNRMQLQNLGSKREYKNSFDCLKKVIVREGIFKLYAGMGASLLRQATYTSTRLGIFTSANDYYIDFYKTEPNILGRMAMGTVAGAIGAFAATPAEVVLIRMTADGRLPVAERRLYKNVVNGLVRIVREEGVLALYRGCMATMSRAMVVNMIALASYAQAKSSIKKQFKLNEGLPLHFYSSMISAFLATVAAMPVDLTKTRIQNMKIIQGKPEFRNSLDVIIKVTKVEGVFALWKGFLPYYVRFGPHTFFTSFLFAEFTSAYKKHFLK